MQPNRKQTGGREDTVLEQGRTLLIANPAARSGDGAKATAVAVRQLKAALPDGRFEAVRTMQPHHAEALARDARAFDTVLALGGDGIIHEAANGLMSIPENERPALGIIPMGSGNDYARTLGMSTVPEQACTQLLSAQPHALDLGCANGEYFTETLSFGADAAIALDTMERRQRAGKSSPLLYLQSGVDQMVHHLEAIPYTGTFDDEPVEGRSITFAVQIGPTYGGGFHICPSAQPDDGLFDICIAHPPASMMRALHVFFRAKNGNHTGFRQIELRQAARIRLAFEAAPPCQADGERMEARTFAIDICPHALRVLMPDLT